MGSFKYVVIFVQNDFCHFLFLSGDFSLNPNHKLLKVLVHNGKLSGLKPFNKIKIEIIINTPIHVQIIGHIASEELLELVNVICHIIANIIFIIVLPLILYESFVKLNLSGL